MKVFGAALWRRIRPLLPAALVGLLVGFGLWHRWPYQPRQIFKLDGLCYQLIFAPDGQHLAALLEDNLDDQLAIKAWHLRTGKECPLPHQRVLPVEAPVAFSPNGQTAAGCFRVGGASKVLVWDLRSGEVLEELACKSKGLFFSPDGALLSVDIRGSLPWGALPIPISDLRSGQERALLEVEAGWIFQDNISAGFVYVWTANGIKIWHARINRYMEIPTPPRPATDELRRLAVSADGKTLVTLRKPSGSQGDEILILETNTWVRRWEVPSISTALALSPDGHLLGTWGPAYGDPATTWWHNVLDWLRISGGRGRSQQQLRLFDVAGGRELATLPEVHHAQFSADGKTLAVARANELLLYDLPLYKPWALIAGLSVAAAALMLLLAKGVARLRRRKPPPGPVGEPCQAEARAAWKVDTG